MKNRVLTIAGFDGSGGAGIQADIKTFSALGCYAMTVLTAIPIQNTQGVRNCYEIPLQCIQEQLEAIFDDILPHAIKIGMLFNSEIINLVSDFLKSIKSTIPIILDPVMCSKSGHTLLIPKAIETLKTQLIPKALIITPNIPEAETLSGQQITNIEDMKYIGSQLLELGSEYVLLKGGHLASHLSPDILLNSKESHWISDKRINTKNDHGTGCTLSAAITAFLALGEDMISSCKKAKQYLTTALESAKEMSIGKGHGPVHHFHNLKPYNLLLDKYKETI